MKTLAFSFCLIATPVMADIVIINGQPVEAVNISADLNRLDVLDGQVKDLIRQLDEIKVQKKNIIDAINLKINPVPSEQPSESNQDLTNANVVDKYIY